MTMDEQRNGASIRQYCKPELIELPYLQLVKGGSCLGNPDSGGGEGDCDPDLFTAEYGE